MEAMIPSMLCTVLNTNNSTEGWRKTGAVVISFSSRKWLQGSQVCAVPEDAIGKDKRTKEKYKAILFI
jgi:hypothetical protein